MAELPLHLKQLEPLPSALDILRFLYELGDHAADLDDICDELDISERRFRKATRRLVTTDYITMRSDMVYELTQKGMDAGEELATYDAAAGDDSGDKLQRRMIVVLPRVLVAGESAVLQYGFEPTAQGFESPVNLVVRFETTHADLSSDSDEQISVGSHAFVERLEITPHYYDRARLKVQVYQLSADGDDLTDCGGMYVDLFVEENAREHNPMIAYGVDLLFNPA